MTDHESIIFRASDYFATSIESQDATAGKSLEAEVTMRYTPSEGTFHPSFRFIVPHGSEQEKQLSKVASSYQQSIEQDSDVQKKLRHLERGTLLYPSDFWSASDSIIIAADRACRAFAGRTKLHDERDANHVNESTTSSNKVVTGSDKAVDPETCRRAGSPEEERCPEDAGSG